MGHAPVVIAAVAIAPDVIMERGDPAYPVDATITVDRMTLAAYEEGLGTCWIGASDQETP